MAVEFLLPKGVKRISFLPSWTAVDSASSGADPYEVYNSKKKRWKKQTRGLRVFGKWNRRWARAAAKMSTVYLRRHDRSNTKKRDGWARDFGFNAMKANRAAIKTLRLRFFRI